MVFRQQKGHAYKLRVTDDLGRSATLTTDAHDQEAADRVEAMYVRFVGQGADGYDVRRLLASKRLSLPKAYYAYTHGTLPALIKELSTPDLDVLAKEWEDEGASPRYVTQLREFVKRGESFPASRFTRKAVSQFLASLKVTGSTKNRYRAALSQFAKWLVERDVLDSNIVRDVAGKPENPSRIVWYTWADAKLLIDGLPEPYKALEALMAGTGMEWQAIANLKRRDIDLKARTVRAHGHKNRHRNRLVKITEAWTLPIITKHLSSLTPNAAAFAVNKYRALEKHLATVKAVGLERSTMHDWRHTYSVNWLQSGGKSQVLKRQLGHAKNSTMVERIYAVWIVDEKDYESTTVTTTGDVKHHA